jgi:hypothetical protein
MAVNWHDRPEADGIKGNLFGVYAVLAVWGLLQWKKGGDKK